MSEYEVPDIDEPPEMYAQSNDHMYEQEALPSLEIDQMGEQMIMSQHEV